MYRKEKYLNIKTYGSSVGVTSNSNNISKELYKELLNLQQDLLKLFGELKKISEKGLETTIKVEVLKEDIYRLETRIDKITEKIEGVRGEMKNGYVKKETFEPIKKILYGANGIILAAVLTALLALIAL